MAVPGFLLVKSKLVKSGALAPFSALLLYVCQPFMSLRSFLEVEYTPQFALNLGVAFVVSFLMQLVVFGCMWLILKKKFDNPSDTAMLISQGFIGGDVYTKEPALNALVTSTLRGRAYRVMVMTATFGNVGFFGIPVLQFLFPDFKEPIAYAAVFVVAMNLLCWTLGAYVLTGDVKHIRLKRALLNPQSLTLVVALPLFFTGVMHTDFPPEIYKVINFFANMTAPLSMIILGMRFGLVPLRSLFTDRKAYIAAFVKIVIFPLLTFLILLPFNMDYLMRATLVLLSGMPAAAMNLNLAELLSGDQKTAADSILLSTLFCMITIPLLMMLV